MTTVKNERLTPHFARFPSCKLYRYLPSCICHNSISVFSESTFRLLLINLSFTIKPFINHAGKTKWQWYFCCWRRRHREWFRGLLKGRREPEILGVESHLKRWSTLVRARWPFLKAMSTAPQGYVDVLWNTHAFVILWIQRLEQVQRHKRPAEIGQPQRHHHHQWKARLK